MKQAGQPIQNEKQLETIKNILYNLRNVMAYYSY